MREASRLCLLFPCHAKRVVPVGRNLELWCGKNWSINSTRGRGSRGNQRCRGSNKEGSWEYHSGGYWFRVSCQSSQEFSNAHGMAPNPNPSNRAPLMAEVSKRKVCPVHRGANMLAHQKFLMYLCCILELTPYECIFQFFNGNESQHVLTKKKRTRNEWWPWAMQAAGIRDPSNTSNLMMQIRLVKWREPWTKVAKMHYLGEKIGSKCSEGKHLIWNWQSTAMSRSRPSTVEIERDIEIQWNLQDRLV